jgi:hypothetical protein
VVFEIETLAKTKSCNTNLGCLMRYRPALLLGGLAALAMFSSFGSNAEEITVHELKTNPKNFDHQIITLQGTATTVKETTSHKGNDYTTFKLQDPNGSDAVTIFFWGHPTLTSGDHVRVDGVFETEHHKGPYTFYNEVEATKITHLPR